MIDRVQIRLGDEPNKDLDFINESIRTVSDRLNLRLGTVALPDRFESIVVDAAIKMYRRQYYEGIQSESADTINTSFVENILDEYDQEIQAYRASLEETTAKNVVRFL